MKKIYLPLLTLLLINFLTASSFAQIEPKLSDKFPGYIENADKSVLESDANNLVSSFSFLSSKVKTGSILEALTVPVKEIQKQIDSVKTRGIQNVSELYKQNSRAIVLLANTVEGSLGAGCIITDDGLILTNYHVISNAKNIETYFYDERISNIQDINKSNYKIAEVIAAYPEKDLALLKLSVKPNMKPLRFGRNSEIEVGADVFAIGHPKEYIWSFTTGVISQLRNNYEWSYSNGMVCKANVIQTQTPINPGNSGGPLFNTEGELIGINSFSFEGQALNFAIRVDELEKFFKEAAAGKYEYRLAEKKKPEILWIAFDSNNNGITDYWVTDLDGDKIYDIGKYDTNEDGVIDYLAVDQNKDRYIDAVIYDKDGDGFSEYWVLDSNYDGTYDTIGIDTDKDGLPDEYSEYHA